MAVHIVLQNLIIAAAVCGPCIWSAPHDVPSGSAIRSLEAETSMSCVKVARVAMLRDHALSFCALVSRQNAFGKTVLCGTSVLSKGFSYHWQAQQKLWLQVSHDLEAPPHVLCLVWTLDNEVMSKKASIFALALSLISRVLLHFAFCLTPCRQYVLCV